MNDSPTPIQALRRSDGRDGRSAVPRPSARWFLRFVLPMMIVLAAVAMLVYAARDALVAAIEVDVVPVVAKAGTAAGQGEGEKAAAQGGEPAIIAQAPGWIEPDPYAVTVQSLISGVVKEVLVLEGERVEQGQVIARLIADDAELAVRRARAELRELQAVADGAAAAIEAAEAQLDEIADEVERKRELVEVGGVSPGEYARLQHRLRSRQADVRAARASLHQTEASVERQRVIVEEAELALERTVIRAPVAGVVLTRSVVPGTRLASAGDGVGEAHFPGVVRLYDPASLQVRADVPLSDAAKIGLGTRARITTEALPDRTFLGEVTRIIHQADMQRNTVQVKVRIHEPSAQLRPDMLSRVRFLGPGDGSLALSEDVRQRDGAGDHGSLRLYIPHETILNRRGDRAQVWVAHPGRGGRTLHARLHDVTLGERDGKLMLVRSGLRPGDRLITNSSDALTPDRRVRIRQSQLTATAEAQGP